jgi:signal transduction histidine kinase
LLDVVAEATPLLGFEPRVRFAGPIDISVPDVIVDDVVAVLREALTNVARHAQATAADVEVAATGTELAIEVTDDGVGIGGSQRRSGLANLRLRAEQHRGTLELTQAAPHDSRPISEGTRLRWTIPLK